MHLTHWRRAVENGFLVHNARMPNVDAGPLNALILHLYRDGREVPLGSFQAWAVEQLRSLVDFDSAWWGNATAHPPALHEVFLHLSLIHI